MKKIIPCYFAVLAFTCARPVCAQYTDSLPVSKAADTVRLSINWDNPQQKRVFPHRSFILPAAMVAYGVVTLNSNQLRSLNEKVKEEVYTERSNKDKIHIDNVLLYAPAAAVYGLNAMGIKGKNNFRDRTMLYAMSQLIQSAVVFPVKKLVAENRPDESNRLSFPSGHTACAFASAEFMRQEYKDVSPWYGVAGYAAAASTGFLRMYNNKHWLSDVVAGAGIGIMSTRLSYWIYPLIKRKLFKDKAVSTVVMPLYQDGALALGLVHHF
ncbi:MAG: phosphatase PAP2 family protein [Chitinophagaceae bacterium]